jgi:hypothetical protein
MTERSPGTNLKSENSVEEDDGRRKASQVSLFEIFEWLPVYLNISYLSNAI